jgi:CheY-like chemotaxis protein
VDFRRGGRPGAGWLVPASVLLFRIANYFRSPTLAPFPAGAKAIVPHDALAHSATASPACDKPALYPRRRRSPAKKGLNVMTTDHSTTRPRVLVVDAEPMICSLLALALPSHGIDVVTAGSEVEAEQALRRQPGGFSVALLSVRGVDGPKTFAALRQVDPRLKAIFMTGAMDPNLEAQLLRLGALAVVHKPFNLHELATLLLAHCQ